MKRRNYIAMMLTLPFVSVLAKPERRVYYINPGDFNSNKKYFNNIIQRYKEKDIIVKIEKYDRKVHDCTMFILNGEQNEKT